MPLNFPADELEAGIVVLAYHALGLLVFGYWSNAGELPLPAPHQLETYHARSSIFRKCGRCLLIEKKNVFVIQTSDF